MEKDFKENPAWREITDEDGERMAHGEFLGPLSASNQSDWLIVSMMRHGFQGAVQPLLDAKLEAERIAFMEWYTSLAEEDIPMLWR